MDAGLENVQDKATMIANGWLICTSDENITASTFWGYNTNNAVNKIAARFEGSGTATLDFGAQNVVGHPIGGHVFGDGHVQIYLNNEFLDSGFSNLSVKVTFNYSRGDILMIKDQYWAIIIINSLKLTNCKGKY